MSASVRWRGGDPVAPPPSKLVCVGRNYAAHATELGNAVPSRPLLFIKPPSTLAALDAPIQLPSHLGPIHHEIELVVRVGRDLTSAAPEEAAAAIDGVGLALDLTARELQSELKSAGHPWERAKSFDGACPVSELLPAADVGPLAGLRVELDVDGAPRQRGELSLMLFDVPDLLVDASAAFTLCAGDLVLTGTPAGVGPLTPGAALVARLCAGEQVLIEVSTVTAPRV